MIRLLPIMFIIYFDQIANCAKIIQNKSSLSFWVWVFIWSLTILHIRVSLLTIWALAPIHWWLLPVHGSLATVHPRGRRLAAVHRVGIKWGLRVPIRLRRWIISWLRVASISWLRVASISVCRLAIPILRLLLLLSHLGLGDIEHLFKSQK